MSKHLLKNIEQKRTEAGSLKPKIGPHNEARKESRDMTKKLLEVVKPKEEQKALPEPKSKIDIKLLAIPQDYADYQIEIKRSSVDVRKPGNQEFIRVLLSEYRIKTFVIRLEKEKLIHPIAPELWEELSTELILVEIFTVVTINGNFFLWPIRIPGGDFDKWNRSALIAAKEAQYKWVRINPNQGKGEYEIQYATNLDQEPQLPDESFEELFERAFKDRYIDSISHPVIKKLRGEAE